MRKIFAAYFVLALAAGFAPASAAELGQEDLEVIDRQIADYFIRNPEKLEQALDNLQVFMEARQRMQQERALADNANSLYRNANDYAMGPKDAPITIVEFFDYNCGYCKRSFAPLMEVLRENKDVRLVFKEYPILGEGSLTAARTALALNDRLKYLTFHSKLMTHNGRIEEPIIEKTLSDMKLSPTQISKNAESAKYQAHIQSTGALARDIGISGTPAFVVNGKLFPGALDKGELLSAVKQARADLKAK